MDNELPRDKASLVAIRFIELFNAALEKHGIRTRIGFEQELDVKYDRESVANLVNSQQNLKPDEVKSIATLPKDISDFLFADSARRVWSDAPASVARKLMLQEDKQDSIKPGFIDRVYREANPNMFEVTYTPSAPLRAAHRAAGMRKFLQSHQAVAGEEGKTAFGNMQVSFPPYKAVDCDYRAIYDLHGNISHTLENPTDKTQPFQLMHADVDYLAPRSIPSRLMDAYEAFARTDLLLVADDARSYTALKNKEHSTAAKKRYNKDVEGEAATHRVEFRLPDARSNPYFVTLLMMAASYHTLHRATENEWSGDGWSAAKPEGLKAAMTLSREVDFPERPETLGEAKQRFKNASRVVQLMQKVATEVGTQQDGASAKEFTELLMKQVKLQSKTPSGQLPGR